MVPVSAINPHQISAFKFVFHPEILLLVKKFRLMNLVEVNVSVVILNLSKKKFSISSQEEQPLSEIFKNCVFNRI